MTSHENYELTPLSFCVDSVVTAVIEKHIFYQFASKTYIVIVVIIIIKLSFKLHCGTFDSETPTLWIYIFRCAFSFILCLNSSGLWMWVKRMIICIYSKIFALTEHWWMLYMKNLSNIRSSRFCRRQKYPYRPSIEFLDVSQSEVGLNILVQKHTALKKQKFIKLEYLILNFNV